MKKILYGISGIGTGHTYRQLPILQHFSRACRIVLFAYGESYKFYHTYFKNTRKVTVVRIAIPFYAGNKQGLDFATTARHPANKNTDFTKINCEALAKATALIGTPDLVITDYEPLSAQYAYAHNAPLVTLDQQSKYLCGNFPPTLAGETYKDEVMRLRMFFPKAHARIACSFFKVNKKQGEKTNVLIFPSTLKNEIQTLKRKQKPNHTSILVYISSQRTFRQNARTLINTCASQRNVQFHIFIRNCPTLKKIPSSITLHEHGDPTFYQILQECSGIVSTAGHMLLSEAMYLGIPVYAMPLKVYEQQMNAHIITQNNFGIAHPTFDKRKLAYFIKNIPKFTHSILNDCQVLLRKPGQKDIINYLEHTFLRNTPKKRTTRGI